MSFLESQRSRELSLHNYLLFKLSLLASRDTQHYTAVNHVITLELLLLESEESSEQLFSDRSKTDLLFHFSCRALTRSGRCPLKIHFSWSKSK